MEAAPQENPTGGSNQPRLPFDAEFIKHLGAFLETVMLAVPELHGIAIVPIWDNQPEKMAAGVLHLRNPQPPYVDSLLAAMRRLAVFNVDMHRDLVQQLGAHEQYFARLSAKIQELEETNKLAAKSTNDDAQ